MLRSLAGLLRTAPPAGFLDSFLRRVDETAAEMAYSDAVLIAGGAWVGGWVLGLSMDLGSLPWFRCFGHPPCAVCCAGLSKLDHEGSPEFHRALLRLLTGCVRHFALLCFVLLYFALRSFALRCVRAIALPGKCITTPPSCHHVPRQRRPIGTGRAQGGQRGPG